MKGCFCLHQNHCRDKRQLSYKHSARQTWLKEMNSKENYPNQQLQCLDFSSFSCWASLLTFTVLFSSSGRCCQSKRWPFLAFVTKKDVKGRIHHSLAWLLSIFLLHFYFLILILLNLGWNTITYRL
jgi:hypothetical protein